MPPKKRKPEPDQSTNILSKRATDLRASLLNRQGYGKQFCHLRKDSEEVPGETFLKTFSLTPRSDTDIMEREGAMEAFLDLDKWFKIRLSNPDVKARRKPDGKLVECSIWDEGKCRNCDEHEEWVQDEIRKDQILEQLEIFDLLQLKDTGLQIELEKLTKKYGHVHFDQLLEDLLDEPASSGSKGGRKKSKKSKKLKSKKSKSKTSKKSKSKKLRK